MMMMSSLY